MTANRHNTLHKSTTPALTNMV